MIETAGERGFGILAARELGARKLFLQARALTVEQAAGWTAAFRTRSAEAEELFRDAAGRLAPLSFAMTIPIRYCPGCGADTRELIEGDTDAFDDLVRRHDRFLQG